jgi:L-ribulokinase
VNQHHISTSASDQGPALGSAIHAAVAAGYDALFAEYTLLHDHFGRGSIDVMHRLKAMKRNTTKVEA